jgi:ABC-type Zn uptake system ZnuABC Zn-binding protein ZnuA
MFECVVVELAGDGVAIMRLAEPGMCPGHFDMRPSQVESLRGCRVLLRLDFQQSLDRKLAGVSGEGLQHHRDQGARRSVRSGQLPCGGA